MIYQLTYWINDIKQTPIKIECSSDVCEVENYIKKYFPKLKFKVDEISYSSLYGAIKTIEEELMK